jgi:beta-glucosidase
MWRKNYTRLLETSVIYSSAITNKISPGFIKTEQAYYFLVLNEGRPRLISDFEDKMNDSSMLFTGNEGARAIFFMVIRVDCRIIT